MGSVLGRAPVEEIGEPVAQLSELNDDLLQAFFSHLTPLDRLRASQVCREWRRLAALKPRPILVGTRGVPRIKDAISAAEPGQVILVCPGRYEESLLLDKEVHIIGTRRAALVCATGTALACRGSAAPSVCGLTIQGGANGAVLISGGSRARIENCDVSCGAGGSAAAVSRGPAEPALRSGRGTGISVCDPGTAPALLRNRVHSCGMAVFFYDEAAGLAEGNLVEGNDWFAFEVSFGADPTVRGNRVRGQRWGVSVPATGRGRVTGNVLEGVASPLEVDPAARCAVDGNVVRP
eukprot:tig00022075_g23573.t1